MKICSFSPYPVYPPRFGGQLRTYSINEKLSRTHKISQFSFVLIRFKTNRIALRSWEVTINDNFREYNYVFPPFYAVSFFYYLNKLNPYVVSSNLLEFSSPNRFKNELKSCDIVQVESPYYFKWVYEQIRNASRKIPIILSEHNVEYLYEKASRPDNYLSNFTTLKIKELEKFAVDKADLIFTVSKDDAFDLERIYSVDPEKIYVVPNGVDTKIFNIVSEEKKDYLKKKFNLQGKRIVLFSGSVNEPNYEALKIIQKIASEKSDRQIIFLVAGSLGTGQRSTENIYYTGRVDNISPYFQMADIAINPMISGSGTNLKMLEYLASGLPTISTEVGARGLGLENGKHAIIVGVGDFTENILNLLDNGPLCDDLRKNGRKLVEEQYDWGRIAEKINTVYESLDQH